MMANGAVNNKHENILGKVKGKMVRYTCIQEKIKKGKKIAY